MSKKKQIIIYLSIYIILTILLIVPPACWCRNKVRICFGDNIVNYNIKNVLDIFKVCFSNIEILIIWLITALILILFIIDIYFTIRKAKIENKGIKFKSEDRNFWYSKLDEF